MKKFLVVFVDNSSCGPEVDVDIYDSESEVDVIQQVWKDQGLDPEEVDESDYFIESINEVDSDSRINFIK